jgi:hypothetical protein
LGDGGVVPENWRPQQKRTFKGLKFIESRGQIYA